MNYKYKINIKMTESIRNIFYWNCADDREHTHKRIEWAIENKNLICINIKINQSLFDKIKIGDIILAYEPKNHSKSKYINGEDGKCMSCKSTKYNGRQAFTTMFIVNNECKIFNTLEQETLYKHETNCNIMKNWYSNEKHLQSELDYNTYYHSYYNNGSKKYIIPVKFHSYLKKSISTNTNNYSDYDTDAVLDTNIIYYGNILKGFNIIKDSIITEYIERELSNL